MLKIHEAAVCVKCDEVFPREKLQCPACTSGSWFPLSNVLRSVAEHDAEHDVKLQHIGWETDWKWFPRTRGSDGVL